jgi:hypothetical protein
MTTPFQHPANVPTDFALAVHTIMHQGCYADGRVLAWREVDKVSRKQALVWIRAILEANDTPDLEEELAWWEAALPSR